MDKTSCFDFSFSWSWSRCTLWSWKVVIVIYSSCLESLLFRPCKQLSCKSRHNLDVDVCLMFMVMFICISPKIFHTKCVFYVKISSHPNRLFLKWIRNVALCNFMLPYSRGRKSDVQKQGKSSFLPRQIPAAPLTHQFYSVCYHAANLKLWVLKV